MRRVPSKKHESRKRRSYRIGYGKPPKRSQFRPGQSGNPAGRRPRDRVNHPAHYGGADNPYEVIKVLRAWLTPDEYRGFLRGNVIKYVARARRKGGLEDDEKARWYQNELVHFEREQIGKK